MSTFRVGYCRRHSDQGHEYLMQANTAHMRGISLGCQWSTRRETAVMMNEDKARKIGQELGGVEFIPVAEFMC